MIRINQININKNLIVIFTLWHSLDLFLSWWMFKENFSLCLHVLRNYNPYTGDFKSKDPEILCLIQLFRDGCVSPCVIYMLLFKCVVNSVFTWFHMILSIWLIQVKQLYHRESCVLDVCQVTLVACCLKPPQTNCISMWQIIL